MAESASAYAKLFQELGLIGGIVAVLLGAVVVALGWLLWRLYPLQKDIKADQAVIASCNRQTAQTLKEVSIILTEHNQRAIDMHNTCNKHGGQLDSMYDGMQEFRTKLLDRMARVEQELAVLKERMSRGLE